MSIKIPRYTIQENQQETKRTLWINSVPLLIISLLVGYYSHSYFSEGSNQTLMQRNTVLEENNTQNNNYIVQLKAEISRLKTEQKIKNEAVNQLRVEYKEIINQINGLKSDIVFYERLLSPDQDNKGLRVFKTELRSLTDSSHALKITLVQKLEKAKIIKGTYRVQLVGLKEGNETTIKLSSDNNSYQFKYFNKISLNFSIPKGFQAQQLVVKLLPKNTKSKTINYTVDWETLTQ